MYTVGEKMNELKARAYDLFVQKEKAAQALENIISELNKVLKQIHELENEAAPKD